MATAAMVPSSSSVQKDVKPRKQRRGGRQQKEKRHHHRHHPTVPTPAPLLQPTTPAPAPASLVVTQSPALNEYISVLKSPESRKKIPERLNQVFKALEIPGSSIEEKAENFAK